MFARMIRLWAIGLVAALVGLMGPGMAGAQDRAWIQIEAQPTEAEAMGRAAIYAARLPDISGFVLRSGWFAIALGPYGPAEAEVTLRRLRSTGAIPNDSFLAFDTAYSGQFWPPGAALSGGSPQPAPVAEAAPPPGAAPLDETPRQAQAGERLLSRPEREDIQRALRTLGFYRSAIDGDFGPGTRRAMQAWQEAAGVAPTGILTTRQRAELLDSMREIESRLGLRQVEDLEAGIAIDLPLGAVSFDGYEAPFARFSGADAQVLLISQSGDRNALAALYAVLQTLEIVPFDGPRNLGRTSFTLTGRNDAIITQAFAETDGGTVKGFVLVWPAEDALGQRLVWSRMEQTFAPLSGVLPDTAGSGADQRPDLLAGLQIRQADKSGSGVFIDRRGLILTDARLVGACDRITVGVDGDIMATIAALDSGLGVALLRPETGLAPLALAELNSAPARIDAEIALAGYSYGGRLGAPTMSYGNLEEPRGLNGEPALARLSISAEDGDVGGPVLDAHGGLVGLLLSRTDTDRSLPPDVRFAAQAPALAAFLDANGVAFGQAANGPVLDPEDLISLGADITALVQCWN